MQADKKSIQDFFVSKAFFSIVTILISYFFSEDASRIVGYGVSFAQEIAATGILGGAAIALWGNFGRVKKKAELRKEVTAIRLNAQEKVNETKEELEKKEDALKELKQKIPRRGEGGKFEPRPKSKPK